LDWQTLSGIARNFSLSPRSARPLLEGTQNTTYLVHAAEGRFVATLLEQRTAGWAEAHVNFVSRLASHGLPVPLPRPSVSGSWIHLHEGKPVTMTAYIEGICDGELTQAELFRLGGVLAEVHTSGVSYDVDPTNRLTERDLAWLARVRRDSFAHWALRQHSMTQGVFHECGIRVLTHGDPFRDNVIVRPNGRLALIDWEDAAIDLPEVDLGIAILAHCDKDSIPVRARCLLSGYHAHGGSREMTLAAVFRMAAYAGLVLAYRRYRRRLEGTVLPEGHQPLKEMVTSLNDCLDGL
jgi:homoserine kinase type II